MMLGKVLGPVVATAHHPAFDARKLLVVQPLDENQKPLGTSSFCITIFVGRV